MNDLISLKQAFIDFIDKLMPNIPDPMFIIGQRWTIFKNILQDKERSVAEIVEYVEQLKIGNIKKTDCQQQARKGSLEANPMNPELFQPETYFKLNLPNKHLFVKQSSQKKIHTNEKRQKSIIMQQDVSNNQEQTLKLDLTQIKNSPRIPSQFKIFFQIQQHKGFSTIIKEYLLDNLQEDMKQFEKHTKTMLCIEAKSFEINTSELTDNDKKLNGQNYSFSTYSKLSKQQQSFKTISIFEQKTIDQNM